MSAHIFHIRIKYRIIVLFLWSSVTFYFQTVKLSHTKYYGCSDKSYVWSDQIAIQHEQNKSENWETLRGQGNRAILPPPIQVKQSCRQEGKYSWKVQIYQEWPLWHGLAGIDRDILQLVKSIILHMWDKVPEERKQRAINHQESSEANIFCSNRSRVQGGGNRANNGWKGNPGH